MGPLPQLRLGSVPIDFPVVQAALSGYSDWPMRVIARRLGAAYTVCEVMLDQFILNVTKGRKAKRFLRVTDEEHPCGAQLMGALPEQFPPAALKLVSAGFDVIDLNFACPVKKVLGRCRGGFLLSDPETALSIIGRVRDALPPSVPLTVKCAGAWTTAQRVATASLPFLKARFAWALWPSPYTDALCGSVTRGPALGSSCVK